MVTMPANWKEIEKKVNKEYKQDPDGGARYVYIRYDGEVCLDGDFPIEDLEVIIKYCKIAMELNK